MSRRLIALAPLLLAGCYLSHPLDVDAGSPSSPDAMVSRLDATISRRDATISHRDAGVPRDDGGAPTDAARVDASTCPGSTLGVEVRVEPITSLPGRCDGSHAEGVGVYGVEPAPADDGIRIHADYCPDADDDCRCDLVVANVGTDLAAAMLIPAGGLTLDVGPTSLRVTTVPTCECLGCPCSYALVLDAADALLSAAPAELELSQGGLVCPEPAPCTSATWRLRAASAGDVVEIPVGEDRDVAGIVHVRSVRDVDVYGPCAACGTCGELRSSWVAWIRH